MIDLDMWYLGSIGHEKIHKVGIEQLSVIIVIHVFVECATDALRHAAIDLSLNDQGIDQLAAVVYHGICVYLNETCGDIDLDNGGMDAAGKGGVRRAEILCGFQS